MSQQQLGYATPVRRPSRFAWAKSKRFRRLVRCAAAVVVCYVGSYACLSTFGRYEPGGMNVWGINWYYWAPAGFAHNYRRRTGLFYAFLPLYLADRAAWHTDNRAWRGPYPRHDPSSLAELERAWKR